MHISSVYELQIIFRNLQIFKIELFQVFSQSIGVVNTWNKNNL